MCNWQHVHNLARRAGREACTDWCGRPYATFATEDDMATRLKLYCPSHEEEAEMVSEPEVRVRLGDLLPVVAMAQRMNFIWLKDFLDDEVAVSQDLYEVMQAFRSSRPTSA
jgi:hypothetical protein